MMADNFDLSKDNIAMLKHLSGINRSIIFREGKDVIKIVDPGLKKFVQANFIVPPKTFGVYNLPQLVSVLNNLNTGNVVLDDESIRVEDTTGNLVKIQFADPETILCSPAKKINIGEVLVAFEIDNEKLNQIQSLGKILDCELVRFFAEDDTIYAETYSDVREDSFRIELSSAQGIEFDEVKILLDLMNFLPSTYNVEIGSAKSIKFFSEKISYFISCEVEKVY